MLKTNQINYYKDHLNVENIVQSIDFDQIDEAVRICDLNKIEEKFHTWQKYMPNIKPYYAVKCNNDEMVLKTLAKLGYGFDCATKNELKQILDLNVAPDRILFAHPCKLITHLECAKKNNINIVTVDNELEMYKIYENYPKASLVIRFRCDAKRVLVLLGKKFGCEPYKEGPALMTLAKKLKLNVIGVSFHVGSHCFEYTAFERALTIAKHLHKVGVLMGHQMRIIDIGGGFPGDDDELFKKFAAVVNKSLAENFPNRNNIEVIAEPGRFAVAASYTIICKIIAKREVLATPSNKLMKMYYLNDGIYGSFKAVINYPEHPKVTVKHFINDEKLKKYKSVLWGPTSDALDKIIDDIYLPDLHYGDLIYFPDMGAYSTSTAALNNFNGFPTPKTIYFHKMYN